MSDSKAYENFVTERVKGATSSVSTFASVFSGLLDVVCNFLGIEKGQGIANLENGIDKFTKEAETKLLAALIPPKPAPNTQLADAGPGSIPNQKPPAARTQGA